MLNAFIYAFYAKRPISGGQVHLNAIHKNKDKVYCYSFMTCQLVSRLSLFLCSHSTLWILFNCLIYTYYVQPKKNNIFVGSAVTQLKVYLFIILFMGLAIWLHSFPMR